MIEFIWRHWFAGPKPDAAEDDAFDLLAHPALQRMDQRELADLPLRPHLCPDRQVR
jgi:hypothetical protein